MTLPRSTLLTNKNRLWVGMPMFHHCTILCRGRFSLVALSIIRHHFQSRIRVPNRVRRRAFFLRGRTCNGAWHRGFCWADYRALYWILSRAYHKGHRRNYYRGGGTEATGGDGFFARSSISEQFQNCSPRLPGEHIPGLIALPGEKLVGNIYLSYPGGRQLLR
jgi:hypothetical protein